MQIKIYTSNDCIACKEYQTRLEKGSVDFKKVDIDQDPRSIIKYKIAKLPTTIIFSDKGKFLLKFVGAQSLAYLNEVSEGLAECHD
jgi:thioredoxin-like negative regulator of GroEL